MITTKTLSASVETILPTSFFLDIYCSYLKLINLSLIFGMLMNIICCIKGIDNQSWIGILMIIKYKKFFLKN